MKETCNILKMQNSYVGIILILSELAYTEPFEIRESVYDRNWVS